ncbi:hypothetical protein DFH09DRAFT_1427412 [Mycena vulgaris]|nr:hypothetical protein DFH09DRAFT_1427412 [Mycena vulgaris]
MALILSIESLSTMVVSFKVELTDGTFAFHMAPVDVADMAANIQPESGMKLHLKALRDSTGVTLTLSTSGNSGSHLNEETLDTAFGRLSLPFGTFDSLFELPDSMDYALIDRGHLIPAYPTISQLRLALNSDFDVSNFKYTGSFTEDSPVMTPSTFSEPSPSEFSFPSGSPPSLGTPDASHTGHLARPHKPSRNVKPREPKSHKYFPCTMGCTMGFSRKHDRLRHEVTQHGRVWEQNGGYTLDKLWQKIDTCIDFSMRGSDVIICHCVNQRRMQMGKMSRK